MVTRKTDPVGKVEVIPPTPKFYQVPPQLTRALEAHDITMATEVVNNYVDGKVDRAKKKLEEEAKKKQPDPAKFLLKILCWIVFSPIVVLLQWVILTRIYEILFK